jgi:hypothetical protein
MMWILLALSVVAAAIFAYAMHRQCLSATVSALTIAIVVFALGNGIYTAYVNWDAGAHYRQVAIATAVCSPAIGPSQPAPDILCPARETVFGYEITIMSARVLKEEEVEFFVTRVRMLKPIITTGRVALRFVERRAMAPAADAAKRDRKGKTELFSESVYKSVEI